jgi:rubrerythrin
MKEFNSFTDILDFAIENEQQAVNFYTELAATARNEDMKNTFVRFAQEEIGHKAKLTKIKEERHFTLTQEKVNDLKISDYTVRVQPTPDMSYQDALVLAMKREKAAFRLYTNLAAKAEDAQLKEIFSALAIEESKHKLMFEVEYDEYVLREN